MLASRATKVAEERSSRKAPLTDREARGLLSEVDRVIVARGRSVRELAAAEASLADLKGPTGKYRAPMILRDRTLLVGWNQDGLERLLTA